MISVVIPVYNEEPNIFPLYDRLVPVLKKSAPDFEIVFVDDGSTDRTVERIMRLHSKDKRVKLIEFVKNNGKAAALQCGFEYASGDIIITMDGDLQDEPNEIPNFIAKIRQGYDLVVGWKYVRHDPWTKTLPSKVFNFLTRKITGVQVHDSNCGFKAMKRHVAKSLKLYGDLHRYIPSLVHGAGFKVGEIKVKHNSRMFGKSKYGGGRIVKGLLDLFTIKFIISFRKRPLHLFGGIALILILIGSVLGAYLSYVTLRYGTLIIRPLFFLAIFLVFVGIQFFSIGLVSELIINSSQAESTKNMIKRVEE